MATDADADISPVSFREVFSRPLCVPVVPRLAAFPPRPPVYPTGQSLPLSSQALPSAGRGRWYVNQHDAIVPIDLLYYLTTIRIGCRTLLVPCLLEEMKHNYTDRYNVRPISPVYC